MPSQELKPCKCGGEAFFAVERISSGGTITAWSVRCRNVKCPRYLYSHWWPTREAAVRDWNRRAEGERHDPGLSRGARLLRRYRTIKRPVFIHPVRGAAGAVLVLPVLAVMGLLSIPLYIGRFSGRFFDWMSDSADCAIDRIGDWYHDLLETEREQHLRFWARVSNGEAPEGWRIDPECPGRLIKEEIDHD